VENMPSDLHFCHANRFNPHIYSSPEFLCFYLSEEFSAYPPNDRFSHTIRESDSNSDLAEEINVKTEQYSSAIAVDTALGRERSLAFPGPLLAE